MKKILLSILCACVFMVTAHAENTKPDITVTKITTTGVTSNVGFKVKDSNDWLKADAQGKWTVTSTDTPVQGSIGEKNYSGFFFNASSTGTAGTNNDTYYYSFDHTLADINDPDNGIVVDPTATGGPLLAPRRADAAQTIENFVIKGNNNLYVIIYNGKVYGTSDISKATKFEAYQLAYSDHNVSCVQTAKAATCEDDGAKAKYHCTICDKYFEEEACTNETSSEIEVIPALGHDYQVVKDGLGNATWAWAADYSTATLHVVCANNAEHNDNQTVTPTSEITTQPTTSATGVLTHTATATYKETTYTGTQTEAIPQLTASEQSVTADAQVTNNSWTTINASNTVGSEQTAPTITVAEGTAENPTTANIVITGENTDAKVNVSVPANATVNIYGDGNATIEGAITATGNANISGAKVKGSITASGTLNISGAKVDGSINASSGAAVTLSNANVTSTTGAAVTVTGGTLVLGKGTYKGKEGEGAFSFTDITSISLSSGLAFFHNGQKVGLAARSESGAKGNRTGAQVSKSQYDTYTVCDANHTVHTYGADGKCTECQVQVPASMTLDDTTDQTSTLQGLIAANAAQNITLTSRTLYKDGYYNTLCLPFALTADQLAASPLAGCTLMEVTGASLNSTTNVMTIQLSQATALVAGKPYLIKWESGTDITSPTFSGVIVTIATPSTISGTNLDVVGIFAPKTMKSSDADLFFLGAENKFYTSNSVSGSNLKGYRCYFKVNSASPAKDLDFIFDEETTGIDKVSGFKSQVSGKYLENGRVVIIRNGKKFNVNGQEVK